MFSYFMDAIVFQHWYVSMVGLYHNNVKYVYTMVLTQDGGVHSNITRREEAKKNWQSMLNNKLTLSYLI